MKKYLRWQRSNLDNALKKRRVVILAGPRQCGKTTLSKELVTNDVTYRTLDDLTFLASAQSDPKGFVKHDKSLMIIDEVQKAPFLLPAIKQAVDENTQPGQYLLTGSANIQSLPGVTESLAGRIGKVRLRGFAEGEVCGTSPRFLEEAFTQKFRTSYPVLDKNELIILGLRGGFPETLNLSPDDVKLWHNDYLEALLDRDLRDIVNIRRKNSMRELLEVLASWSGKYMDLSSILSGLSIKRPTAESYINALEALYLVEKIPPWVKTDYERVGRQHKILMSDSGLVASLLNWNREKIEFDCDKLGKFIETFIFNQISVQIESSNAQYKIYHYRDREKREVDFIVEREDGIILGIEVKAGSTIGEGDFKHLKWFKGHIHKTHNKPFIGVVLSSSDCVSSFGDNLWSVPISSLWG
jgi:predicted AAA+ superfamily ATPase